jgi:hypothetical protein
MSAYTPPTENLPVFNSSVFLKSADVYISQSYADTHYLKFPTGQGTESIPDLIVAGTSTLGITTTSQFTATTGSYGTAQKFFATTADLLPLQLTSQGSSYEQKFMKIVPASSIINYLTTQAEQYNGTGYAQLELTSGDLTATPPKVVLQAFVDYDAFPAYTANVNKITLGNDTGRDIYITNGNPDFDLPENNITLHQDGTYSNNYVRLRSAFAYNGIESFLTLGVDNFNLTINNQTAFTITNGANDPVVYRRNISLTTFTSGGTPCGVLEKTLINTTTTGSTTLTIANAFQTTINTPTAINRIFILPAPTAGAIGYWYGFCNKATGFIITIQYPGGTTIGQLSNFPSSGYAARFAVDTGGTTYSRIS